MSQKQKYSGLNYNRSYSLRDITNLLKSKVVVPDVQFKQLRVGLKFDLLHIRFYTFKGMTVFYLINIGITIGLNLLL